MSDSQEYGGEDVAPAAEVVGYTELETVLFKGAELEAPDPTEGAMAIVRRVMQAQSAADVLTEDEVIHAKDLLDTSFIAVNVHWNRSTVSESGPSVYAVIDATNDDGEAFTVTCGGIRVMAQLARLSELGALPARVKVLEARKPTAAGFYPLRLVAG